MARAGPREKQRIVIFEDDLDLQDLLAYNLTGAGHDVRGATTAADGLELVETFRPDLVLLDLMLPDLSGLEVCRRIRAAEARPQPVVIILTAKGDEIDRVVGFEIGADDYVVKPFSMRELLLRVRAHLRFADAEAEGRAPSSSSSPSSPFRERPRRRFEIGPLRVDLDGHRVTVDEEEIPVSALEMRLLAYLAQSEGTVCSRAELLTDVWHYSPDVTTRTVDTHVKRLRDKLGPAGALIQTVRGLGYRLSDPASARRSRGS
jgi:two-component system, OmpR family, phosphate regulon response regulator PhoB